jgi:integrase/recombinase XerD
MPKIQLPYIVRKRTDTKKFIVTLNRGSGLPIHVCSQWNRASFSNFPPELSQYRDPRIKSMAESGALALIEFLKKQGNSPDIPTDKITVGGWLVKFTSLEDNPRSARLIAESSPYSPDTIAGYRQKFDQYLKGDPLMAKKMISVEEADALAFIGRLGLQQNKYGKPIAGTRTFEIVSDFVRMAFHEYWEEHRGWIDPFSHIKSPKNRKGIPRDVITAEELLKLFAPGVITDPLQKAICAAMFFAGLRRSEIFALRPEDLDWKTPRLKITHAWKRFGTTKREMGDPKWHKCRDTIFPKQLQEAIRELWDANGQHDFVFCRKDGSQPKSGYVKYHLPRWLEKAGIYTEGRTIVPHSARHSLASLLEADGVPLRYIQKMLGHTDLETTIRYLHEPADTINKISEKVGVKQPEQPQDEKKVLKIKQIS